MKNNNPDIKPDIHLVALDETEYWTIPEQWTRYIERIESAYFFDMSVYTYVAEVTPSYELWFWIRRAATTSDCPDDVRDEIDQYVNESVGDEEQIIYMHASAVDRIVAERVGRDNDWTYVRYGQDDDLDDLPYLERMEEYLQRFSANYPL